MKLLLAAILFFNLGLSYAQEVKTYTCKDLYMKKIIYKDNKRKNRINDSKYGIIAGVYGAFVFGSLFPPAAIVAGLIIVSSSAVFIANDAKIPLEDGGAERVLENVADEKFYNKIFKKVPGTNHAEVDDVLEEGFRSGEFCRSYKLMSHREIRKYVILVLDSQ